MQYLLLNDFVILVPIKNLKIRCNSNILDNLETLGSFLTFPVQVKII